MSHLTSLQDHFLSKKSLRVQNQRSFCFKSLDLRETKRYQQNFAQTTNSNVVLPLLLIIKMSSI